MRKRLSMSAVSQFSDDNLEHHRDDFNNLQLCQVKFLLPHEIMKQLEQHIEEIQEIFCLNFDQALQVFNYYRFNMQELQSKFIIEHEEVIQRLHMSRKHKTKKNVRQHRSRKTMNCRSCYEDHQECDTLECGHEFCVSCWKSYLKAKIQDHQLFLPCMEQGCRSPALHSFIVQKFKDDQASLKLYQLNMGKRYIDESQQQNIQNIKWCPGLDCEYSALNVLLEDPDVCCPQGHQWCFICRKEAHNPVSCQIVQSWQHLINKSNDTVKWITDNTKLCPFCKRPVEKNQGCHFINCRPPGGCGKNFCYACNNPWEPTHSDHFKCPFENNHQQKNEQEIQDHILSTYNSHYQHFTQSNQSCAYIKNTLQPIVPGIRDSLVSQLNLKPEQLEFINETLETIHEAQLKLKWTYCLTHFMEESKKFRTELSMLQSHQEELTDQIALIQMRLKEQLFDKVCQDRKRVIKKIDLDQSGLDELKNQIVAQLKLIHHFKHLIVQEIIQGDCFVNQ